MTESPWTFDWDVAHPCKLLVTFLEQSDVYRECLAKALRRQPYKASLVFYADEVTPGAGGFQFLCYVMRYGVFAIHCESEAFSTR